MKKNYIKDGGQKIGGGMLNLKCTTTQITIGAVKTTKEHLYHTPAGHNPLAQLSHVNRYRGYSAFLREHTLIFHGTVRQPKLQIQPSGEEIQLDHEYLQNKPRKLQPDEEGCSAHTLHR
jgi:hypothetical protein